MVMLIGLANGGPLAGIKLTAPESWNGKIIDPIARVHAKSSAVSRIPLNVYYDGRYAWREYDDKGVWEWIEVDPLWELLY